MGIRITSRQNATFKRPVGWVWDINRKNNKYKTGKLFHVYRPFVIDSDNNKAWCTSFLYKDGKLTVELPKEFMDSAVYPVRLDPIIGYNTAGGSSVGNRFYVYIPTVDNTAGSDGTVTDGYAYLSGNNSDTATIGYYDDDSPNALQDSDNVVPDSADWYNVSITGSISSGNDYFPAVRGQTNSVLVYRDFSAGQGYSEFDNTDYGALPATLNIATSDNYDFSVYIDYTEGGGGGNPWYHNAQQE